jgi:type IV fimbrial biogenesis protein FimT
LFVERDGVPALLRAEPAISSISIAGAATDLSFTPPAGQVIGGFRSFDLAPRGADSASNAAARRCIRLAAGGRPRMTAGSCGASA